MAIISTTKEKKDRIRPWQRKALSAGRTPLPEAPGLRPWAVPGERPKRREEGTKQVALREMREICGVCIQGLVVRR